MRSRARKSARRGGLALAGIVAVALLSTTTVFASHTWDDVPTDHPFHDDIAWATERGVANGFPDDTFRPNQTVSRGAMTAFLHNLYDVVFPQQSDRPFHLLVDCGATERFALVNPNGTFNRGSAGTTSTRIEEGAYVVSFDVNVTQCGWFAIVGSGGVGATTT